jgi:Fe-S-cluster containining protein
MIALNCDGCDFCCTHQTWDDHGVLRGITVFPDEIEHFPQWAVFPLLRRGSDIFAYQLGQHICPMYQQGRCAIYDFRPVVCKSFPVCREPKKGLVIAHDRCLRLASATGNFNYESFSGCFDAAREREKRENGWPEATAAFSLRTKSWIQL